MCSGTGISQELISQPALPTWWASGGMRDHVWNRKVFLNHLRQTPDISIWPPHVCTSIRTFHLYVCGNTHTNMWIENPQKCHDQCIKGCKEKTTSQTQSKADANADLCSWVSNHTEQETEQESKHALPPAYQLSHTRQDHALELADPRLLAECVSTTNMCIQKWKAAMLTTILHT